MIRHLAPLPLATSLLLLATPVRAGDPPPLVLGFEADAPGAAPAGFSFGRTGGGAPGRWVVRGEADAPEGRQVLVQLEADPTDLRFPVAVAEAPVFQDGRVEVRCKPISGRVDRACGVVLRYRDAGHYYLARANALEDNTRLYVVEGGHRRQLASFSGPVSTGAWHRLALEAVGEHLQVWLDGKQVLDARDRALPGPGKAGVWTKADSVTAFDALTITPR